MGADLQDAMRMVDETASLLQAEAESETVCTKLKYLNEACRHVVMKAGHPLTVPAAMKAYATMTADPRLGMAEQSVRNKRGGLNPYHRLYAAWEAASRAKLMETRPRHPRRADESELLARDDLNRIEDLGLRHHVRLVAAENRNLRSQINILKQARGAPTLKVQVSTDARPMSAVSESAVPMLNVAELAALKDFVDPQAMRGRRLRVAADGAVETLNGQAMADPGLFAAIEKVIKACSGS